MREKVKKILVFLVCIVLTGIVVSDTVKAESGFSDLPNVRQTYNSVEKDVLNKSEQHHSIKTDEDGLLITATAALVSTAVILVLTGCILIDRKRKLNKK